MHMKNSGAPLAMQVKSMPVIASHDHALASDLAGVRCGEDKVSAGHQDALRPGNNSHSVIIALAINPVPEHHVKINLALREIGPGS